MIILKVKDETFAGKITNEIELHFKGESTTVKDIIIERVSQEVDAYNDTNAAYFNGLIEPSDAEKTLNGFKLKPKALIDKETQCYVALDAFQKNGFFVLIDDLQAENLTDIVTLRDTTEISFVKLTPLIGG